MVQKNISSSNAHIFAKINQISTSRKNMAERITINKIRFYEVSKTNHGFVYQLTSLSDGDHHKIQIKQVNPSHWSPDWPANVLKAVHRIEDYLVKVRSNWRGIMANKVGIQWTGILVATYCTKVSGRV